MKIIKKSGMDVYYGFSDLLAQAQDRKIVSVERYLLSFSAAIISWERDGNPNCQTLPEGNIKCYIRIKGKVIFKGQTDPSFTIINPQMSRPVYKAGEDVSFSYGISQEAFVYIFSVDEERNTYLVFPNKILNNDKLAASNKIIFPGENSGLSLIAVLPEGKDSATEVLYIIASKKEIFTMEEFMEKEIGQYKLLTMDNFREIMSRLSELERNQWTMKVIPYQIIK